DSSYQPDHMVNKRPDGGFAASLNLHAAHRCNAAADVIGPIDVAVPHRHAVRKRTAFGQLNRISDIAGDHVAPEERAHVRVRFPEILRVGCFDSDAVRAIADSGEHVLDGPCLRIDSVDHPRRRHRHPQLAELRLYSMSARTRSGRTWIAGDRAAASDPESIG